MSEEEMDKVIRRLIDEVAKLKDEHAKWKVIFEIMFLVSVSSLIISIVVWLDFLGII
jgi:hypothetical protein